VNSAVDLSARYEDFLVQDLVPEVDSHWRTLRSSHKRAIAGLSMGGYGALKFAIKYPDTFAVAASISGAFTGPADLDEKREDLRDDLRAAFGPAGSITRRENDLFQLLPKTNPQLLPYFYLDCGTADDFCETNRRFAALLCSHGARYEYHEVPGCHSWQYWDQRIANVLPLIDKMLRPAE
jgi:putative tributyrin esterase